MHGTQRLVASIPIESRREPAVLENTRAAKPGRLSAAFATRPQAMPRTPNTMATNEAVAFTEPVGRQGSELTGSRCRLRFPRTKTSKREMAMKWKAPVIIEIAIGLEINAYACAEVK